MPILPTGVVENMRKPRESIDVPGSALQHVCLRRLPRLQLCHVFISEHACMRRQLGARRSCTGAFQKLQALLVHQWLHGPDRQAIVWCNCGKELGLGFCKVG